MDSDSDIEYNDDGLSNIGSIPTKQTLLLVNNFIINTVDFMNKFAALCERKLSNISTKTQKLEIGLDLLEAKLESIPWLETNTTPTPAPVVNQPEIQQQTAPVVDNQPPPPPPPPSEPRPQPEQSVTESAPKAPSSSINTDPRYEKYFKMLKVGLRKEQVQMKMQQEGVDPSILDMDASANALVFVGDQED